MKRRLEYQLYKDSQSRVAAILFELITRYGGKCGHGHEIDIRLTQQELAELAGTSRPVVSTILNKLRHLGIIAYTRNFICINDTNSLRRNM